MQESVKTKRLVVRLATAAVLMFGFGFALVPLYEVFCDITGLNGKNFTQGPAAITGSGSFSDGESAVCDGESCGNAVGI
jgi:cytochrome c oxidase assembly protein subunit 11